MCLLNGTGIAHSLGREEQAPNAFQLKNNKYIMKILKLPHCPLNYTKYPCKNIKIPPKAKLLFCLGSGSHVGVRLGSGSHVGHAPGLAAMRDLHTLGLETMPQTQAPWVCSLAKPAPWVWHDPSTSIWQPC